MTVSVLHMPRQCHSLMHQSYYICRPTQNISKNISAISIIGCWMMPQMKGPQKADLGILCMADLHFCISTSSEESGMDFARDTNPALWRTPMASICQERLNKTMRS
ncbi:hypothetical protein MLD38_026511 [Melastoma candidum]|uniref:Uncharacterized protein n=1 Tax=Melastoma candidum TaxID=119954 RepID=A0ACB9NYL0_9MYRT|nr:hypothetical protein MLD38_026511 [Melastoma candidum]